MSPLELAVFRRNARLRALRALGVPIRGSWQFELSDFEWVGTQVLTARLLFLCGTCPPRPRVSRQQYVTEKAGRLLADYLDLLRQVELDMLMEFFHNKAGKDCSHLLPLLDADAPELLALTELELLSNG